MAEVKMDIDALDNSFEKRINGEKEEHLKPVVSKSGIVSTKPSFGKKFKEAFISEDMKDVSDYIFLDIVVPGIKNAILDTLERVFFNGGGGYGRNRNRNRRDDDRNYGRTSYTSYYRSSNRRPSTDDRRDRDKDRDVDYRNIVVSRREDAEEIVRQLRYQIHEYDSVTVARLLDLIDEPGRYTDNNYGWTREEDIGVRRVRDGYLIDVPEAEYLEG